MGNFINEDFNAFKGGLAAGIVICGGIFFGNVVDFAGQYLIKLALTGIGGLVGGIATAYGKHLFEKYQKKKHGNKENSEEESSQKKSNKTNVA